jgi:serine/threonine protein kinase
MTPLGSGLDLRARNAQVAPRSVNDMIGEALGSYRIVAELGSGAMGVVYLAEHQRIERRVAIKVLNPELTGSSEVVRRFLTEARATSLIHHPGIVEVFDCEVDGRGRAYIVMEHLQGQTLGDRLDREHKIPWPGACAVAAQIASAVSAAHEKGIVHRDLKPDNVFLVGGASGPREAPTVKVLDFGIAKLLSGDWSLGGRTNAGALIGTPEYMSPEQCGGATDVDHRADVYALGCMLFEMISGHPPFVRSTMREVIAAHLFRPAPSLAVLEPASPAWLDDLVAGMLSKEPAARPQSMHEVARALAGSVDTLCSTSAPAPIRSRVHATWHRVGARRKLAAALAIALVAGGVWGVGSLSARGSRPLKLAAATVARRVAPPLPPPPAAPADPAVTLPEAPAPAPAAATDRHAGGGTRRDHPARAPRASSGKRASLPDGTRVEMDGLVDL